MFKYWICARHHFDFMKVFANFSQNVPQLSNWKWLFLKLFIDKTVYQPVKIPPQASIFFGERLDLRIQLFWKNNTARKDLPKIYRLTKDLHHKYFSREKCTSINSMTLGSNVLPRFYRFVVVHPNFVDIGFSRISNFSACSISLPSRF